MYSSLDSIDIVTQNEETGRKSFLQTDHRSAGEIHEARELSTLFALTRMLNARQAIEPDEGPVDVLYVCSEPPPEFLRGVVASAGGRVQINDEPVSIYEGPLGAPADLAESAFRGLAHRVAHEHGAALDEHLLRVLEARYARQPDVEEDEPGYWSRVVALAAVVGEILRARHGGRWVESAEWATIPFAFSFDRQNAPSSFVNVVGRAERFLTHGERDSLVHLLRTMEDQAQSSPESQTPMFTLKPADWSVRDQVLCRPLFDAEPGSAVPLVAYGRDMPHSFALFTRGGGREAELDALHAQSLKHLEDVPVEIEELDDGEQRMLAVSGHFFAAEKVLDASFLRAAHARLKSPVLFAAVPRKGVLLLTGAPSDGRVPQAFLELCAEEYASEDSASISPVPLIIEDGRIRGLAPMEDEAPLAPALEWMPKPGPGGLKN